MSMPALITSSARAVAGSLMTLAGGGQVRRRAPVTARRSGRADARGHRVLARGSADDERGPLGKALDAADTAANAVADLVPATVAPRPVVKTGVLVLGGAVVLSAVGKLISTVVFVGLVGAGGWLLFQASQEEEGGGGRGGKGKGKGGGAAADALAEARRLMDKYK